MRDFFVILTLFELIEDGMMRGLNGLLIVSNTNALTLFLLSLLDGLFFLSTFVVEGSAANRTLFIVGGVASLFNVSIVANGSSTPGPNERGECEIEEDLFLGLFNLRIPSSFILRLLGEDGVPSESLRGDVLLEDSVNVFLSSVVS